VAGWEIAGNILHELKTLEKPLTTVGAGLPSTSASKRRRHGEGAETVGAKIEKNFEKTR
jgi:hypothetical protein